MSRAEDSFHFSSIILNMIEKSQNGSVNTIPEWGKLILESGHKAMLLVIHHSLDFVRKCISELILFTTPWLYRFMFVIGIVIAALGVLMGTFLVGVAQYSFGYWLVMPAMHIENPVYFDYGSIGPTQGPNATVFLHGRQWEPSEHTRDIYINEPTSLLANMGYDIYLQVLIPNSQVNARIGLFQCSTKVFSIDDVLLAKSTRPVTMPYLHPVLNYARRFLLLIPLLLGIVREDREIILPLMEHFIEHPNHASYSLQISLSRPVQVAKARVYFATQLKGVRYFLYHWFFASMFAFVLTSMSIQLLFVLIVVYYIYLSIFDKAQNLIVSRPLEEPHAVASDESAFANQADLEGFDRDIKYFFGNVKEDGDANAVLNDSHHSENQSNDNSVLEHLKLINDNSDNMMPGARSSSPLRLRK